VMRCDQPGAGPIISTDRIAAMGTAHDKHDAHSAPAAAKAGKLQLIRTGTTLRYLVAEAGQEPREIRREPFTDDDLTAVLLLADTGMSASALTVRFTDFSVTADELPLRSVSDDQAIKWIVAWLAGSAAAISLVFLGVSRSRKRKLAAAAA
ncbi:MAG: DUF1583 domain-containing protein, partial [Pirellulales bacterium]